MNPQAPTLKPACLALLACLPLLSGCTLGGSTSASAENDRLRRQAIELNDTIAALQGEVTELKLKLEAAATARGLNPDVIQALPVVTRVTMGDYSSVAPPEGAATGVRVEFSPRDGRDRFVQCVGRVTIEALLLPAAVGASEPRRLGAVTLEGEDLRNAYRSGMLGTYYEAFVPIPPDLADAARKAPVLVRLEFVDFLSGSTQKAEQTIAPR